MIENQPTVYNGPNLYHGEGSVYNGNGVYNNEHSVEFGGIKYIYKKINGLFWLRSSLKNITSNSYVTPRGVDAGLLYPYTDFSQIETLLHDGWRIPTKDDFINLLGGVDELYDTPNYLSEIDGGEQRNGFDGQLIGYINSSNQFLNYGVRGYIWTNTPYSSSYIWNVMFSVNDYIAVNDYSSKTTTKLQIRLCKDA